MTIPINLLNWLIALLPIAALLILMIKFRWKATKAAPVGMMIALLSALFVFDATTTLVVVEGAKGLWSAFIVILIIWPAILIYEVSNTAKAFATFRLGIQKLLPNELLQLLALGWCFVGFLIGVTGFGVPVAVGAPLLLGIGVAPLYAVIIALIGHAWGNTFGTLAAAWDSLRMVTNLDNDPAAVLSTAMWAGAFIWLWNFIIGISICYLYGKKKAIIKGLPAVITISILQGGGQLLMSQINQTIACFLPACVALVAVIILGRTKLYNKEWRIEDSKIMSRTAQVNQTDFNKDMSLSQAFLPYIILTVITLAILLIAPINDLFGQVKLGFSFPETSTGYGITNPAVELYSPISPFTHASLFMLVSAIFGLVYFKKKNWIKSDEISGIFSRSFKKTIPSGFAVIGFLLTARIMSGSGQTLVLAEGMSQVLGEAYCVLAPVVGLLGSFMTSSNMASNILFGEFQMATASLLGLNTSAVLGAQTAGGAVGGAICPGNIILGITTVGIAGQEGTVLKKILPLTITTAISIGIILYITQKFFYLN